MNVVSLLCHGISNFGAVIKCLFGARVSALGPRPNVIRIHQNVKRLKNSKLLKCFVLDADLCPHVTFEADSVLEDSATAPRTDLICWLGVKLTSGKNNLYYWNNFSSLI